jgi:hypothetical protein
MAISALESRARDGLLSTVGIFVENAKAGVFDFAFAALADAASDCTEWRYKKLTQRLQDACALC